MFRRSRFSVRPNVSTTGRTAAASQEAPSSNQEATESPRDTSTNSNPAAVTDTTSAVTPQGTASGDGGDHIVEGSSSSSAVQRRKRFSVKPKVAPGRPSLVGRTPKSPIKSVSESPVEVPSSDLDKPTTSSQTGTTAAPQGLQSPKRRRLSEESKQPKVQPQITVTPSDSSGIEGTLPLPKELLQKTTLPTDSGNQSESKLQSQVKDVPPRPQDKVPPSLPDKKAVEISERAKTLVSSKSGLSLTPSTSSLSKLLNDPSDLQRLAKAQKLRELLRQERHKEKKVKKSKIRVKEYNLDPSKMTMSDLIHYLPLSNPMTSSLEDMGEENETVVPPSPGREESPESAQRTQVSPKVASLGGEEVEEEEQDVEEEDQEEALMVPQVKVAEDGSLIIDEESLTVEVLRAKGPNPAQDRDPIFERGSTTTYSSFRTVNHSKPWSNEETDMFFLAISMVGTDFTMISQLFPHRARSEIKNKFKKEERQNSWRIDRAFRERHKLDIEYFSKLLEKILEFQKNKKKLKSLAKQNAPKKSKRKTRGKKATSKLNDVEEEEEDDANDAPDLEDEEGGEKENEELCNEGKSSVSKPKKQRKRKTKQTDSNEEPKERKKKRGEKSSDQAEACIPEDTEAALPEEHTSSNIREKTENANPSEDTTVKPPQLSRGRAPKPLVPLGRKWGKKALPHSTKAKDTTSDNGDENVCDGTSKEQANKDSSLQASKKQSADGDVSSEDEHASVQPPRPTRYGRIPKPIQPLNYLAKEDVLSSASDATPGSPVVSTASTTKSKSKSTAKRVRSSKQKSAQVSKKPKLVTLRASQSEYSDDEDEKQQDHEVIDEEQERQFADSLSEDGSAPAFVPASLRSPPPVISEVEETMEELDILANIPDVLGISQDALCPGVSWEQAQNETGTPEPCEHQLDLLVDVIDFLSSEHQEVCEDESYNEAAQTLLAIGNPAHLPQTSQNQLATQDHIPGTLSISAKQTGQHLEEASCQETSNGTPLTFGNGNTDTSETISTVEQQHTILDSSCIPIFKTSDQTCDVPTNDAGPSLQLETESLKKSSPPTRKGRLSKVKPKPNLGRSSKTVQPKSQPDTRAEQTAEESNSGAANHQVTEAPEIIPSIPQFCSTDEISCTKVKLAEKLSQDVSSAATSDQNRSESEKQSRCFSDAQFELSRKQVNRDTQSISESSSEKLTSPAQTIASSSTNLATSDLSLSETQLEQASNRDSVPLKEVSQHTAAEVSEIITTHCGGSRLQKDKPNPNIPQTSRTARLTHLTKDKKDSVENDSTPILNLQEKEILESEVEENCGPSPEKLSHNVGPAAALIPLDPESTLSPTMELSPPDEDKRTDNELVGQLYFPATSDQSCSENYSLSDVPFTSTIRDTGPTSASIDEKWSTQDKPVASSDDLVSFLSAVTVSQAGQESREHPVTPVEDLPDCQKTESEDKTFQSRRNRLQKVKPKPNIPQTPRTARSTPQTIDFAEKNDNPTPAVVPSCGTVSTLSNTEKLPANEKEKRTDEECIGQIFSVASTSGQCVSENSIYGEPVSSSANTDQKCPTENEMTENSDFLVISDSPATEPQAGQDVAAVPESAEDPATHGTPVEDLNMSLKEVSEVTSVFQSRSGRFQKVKPSIPQRSTTTLLTPQTKDKNLSPGNGSNPSPILKVQEKAVVESEPEGDCETSPESHSHSIGPATASISSFDPEMTLSPAKKPLTTKEDKRTEDGLVGQLHVAALSLGQSDSENQILSDVSFKPSGRDTESISATVDEKDKPVESSDYLVTSLSAATVSQAGQDSRENPATHVTPVEESKRKTSGQSRRNRLQKVKPNIPQTPRTARSSPQTTKACEVKAHNPTPALKAAVPSFDSASTFSATQELPTIEKEERVDNGCTGQVLCVASTSGQSVSENQIFAGISFEPNNEEMEPTSATTDQKCPTQNEMTENSDFLVTSDSVATEPKAGHDLAAVTESAEDPATHVTPVEDLNMSPKEVSEVTSIFQSRSGRFQKVKPKPNIPQRSRTPRSCPQTSDCVEKAHSSTPTTTSLLTPRTKDKKINVNNDSNPETDQKKPIVGIEPEEKCGTAFEKPSHSVGPASTIIPSPDLESILLPTKEPLTTEEDKNRDDGHVGHLYFAKFSSGQSDSENQSLSEDPFNPSNGDTGSATIDEKGTTQDTPAESRVDLVTSASSVAETCQSSASGQCVSENKVFSDVSFVPSDETTDKKLPTQNEITTKSSDIPLTSDSAAKETQAGQDLAAVTESNNDPAPHVTPVEDLPVNQKEPNEVGYICQSRICRSQKVEPKPNIVVEANAAGAISGQFGSENQSLSDAPHEARSEAPGSVSAATDDTAESSGHPVTSDPAPTESQIGLDVAPFNKCIDHLTFVSPVSQKQGDEVSSVCQPRRDKFPKGKFRPNLAQSSGTVQSKPQIMSAQLDERPSSPTSKSGSTDNIAAEVEALPICTATLPEKPSQSTNTSSFSVEISSSQNTTEELSMTMKQKTELARNLHSESSEPKVPQKRRRVPKVNPNLGSSSRAIRAKSQPTSISSSNLTLEKQPEENDVHLNASHCPLNTEHSLTTSALDASENRLDRTHDTQDISMDVISIATSRDTENQSVLINSVIDNKSSEISTSETKSTGDKMSDDNRGDDGSVSKENWKLDMSTDTHRRDNSTSASKDAHTSSRTNLLLASNVASIPDAEESCPHPCLQSEANVRSQDERRHFSETSDVKKTPIDIFESSQSTDTPHSDLTDSFNSSKKTLQTPRGRLIKPKPNLRRSRPLQPQIQSTTQGEADSGAQTEDGGASVSHDPVLKLQTDIPEPVEGAGETYAGSKQECPPNDTESLLGDLTQVVDQPSPNVSSLGCLTQVLDSSSQNTPILMREEEAKINPCLALFPHMTSEQVPSDPDEPFFILSLTEIPVGSSGELVDTGVQPLSFSLVEESSVQQQSSVSGESLAPVREGGPVHADPVSTSTEDISEVGFIGVKDAVLEPPDNTDLIMENPVNPQENTTVHPLKLQETVEDNSKTRIPPTKGRRRAKLQDKANTARKTRASKTFGGNANKDSELPGPSMQPEGSGGSDLLTEPQKRNNEPEKNEQEPPAGGKGPENDCSAAQTQTSKAATRTRTGKSSTPSNVPSSGKTPSKGSEVKTPQTRRKHSEPTLVTSLSPHATPTASVSQQPEEIHSTCTTSAASEEDIQKTTGHTQLWSEPIPGTSQCTAEVSAPQQSPESFTIEDEPTSVSQYFICDIFTEVDED